MPIPATRRRRGAIPKKIRRFILDFQPANSNGKSYKAKSVPSFSADDLVAWVSTSYVSTCVSPRSGSLAICENSPYFRSRDTRLHSALRLYSRTFLMLVRNVGRAELILISNVGVLKLLLA